MGFKEGRRDEAGPGWLGLHRDGSFSFAFPQISPNLFISYQNSPFPVLAKTISKNARPPARRRRRCPRPRERGRLAGELTWPQQPESGARILQPYFVEFRSGFAFGFPKDKF